MILATCSPKTCMLRGHAIARQPGKNQMMLSTPVQRVSRGVQRYTSTKTVVTLAAAPSSIDTNAPSADPAGAAQRVGDIASADEFKEILASSGDKMVVLMCKASKCRPCKTFKPKYAGLAEIFSDCEFYSVIGDRNDSTRQLMRDYKVRATPTFLFFRNGKEVHSHSGVNAQNMLNALKECIKSDEAGDLEAAKAVLEASN